MKPPICFLCNNNFGSELYHIGSGGSLVQFADYKPLGMGMVGHPRGLEWFCSEHLPAAQELVALPSDEALKEMERRYGNFPPYVPAPYRDPELWLTSVGPNKSKIFALVRQATLCTPGEAIAMISSGHFKVSSGSLSMFSELDRALLEAGAKTELRFP